MAYSVTHSISVVHIVSTTPRVWCAPVAHWYSVCQTVSVTGWGNSVVIVTSSLGLHVAPRQVVMVVGVEVVSGGLKVMVATSLG